MAMNMARYVDGGAVQEVALCPLDPTSTPSDAKMLSIASSMLRTPERGPKREMFLNSVCLVALGWLDVGEEATVAVDSALPVLDTDTVVSSLRSLPPCCENSQLSMEPDCSPCKALD